MGIGALPADSILAFDWNLRRASVFGPAGEFVRSFQLEPGDDGLPRPIGVMGGSLLVSSALIFDPSSPDGVHRITATLYRYDLEGHRLATLGEILDAERYVRSDENAPSVRFTLPPSGGVRGSRPLATISSLPASRPTGSSGTRARGSSIGSCGDRLRRGASTAGTSMRSRESDSRARGSRGDPSTPACSRRFRSRRRSLRTDRSESTPRATSGCRMIRSRGQ